MLLMPVFALLGLFIGSFLNVCIDRLPKGQSIINPPSHCSACNHKLGILDMVPVFSYLWLHGRCRYCQARIPIRLPIVEGTTGLLFTFLYWRLRPDWMELAIFLIYACLLTIIFVIDLENQLVLNRVTYPGMALAIVFSFIRPEIRTFSFFWPTLGVESSLAGGALGLVVIALIVIIYPQGMGSGDVKMAALVGLMTGFPLVIVAILLWWISGGLVSSILLALKVKKLKDALPSATFLTVAAMVTLLWGKAIYQWYLLFIM